MPKDETQIQERHKQGHARGERVRMRGEERRELILQRAKHVFAERGYADASTGELAHASEVTEPMLYKHFGSKKGLFLDVMRVCSQGFMERWERQVRQRAERDIREALTHAFSDYHAAFMADPDTQRVLFQAVSQASDSDIASRLRKHNQKIQAVIQELLHEAHDQDLLAPDVDVKAASWGYLSMSLAMQYNVMLNLGSELFDKSLLRKMSQLWLRAIIREP